jgi:hypothetical protein
MPAFGGAIQLMNLPSPSFIPTLYPASRISPYRSVIDHVGSLTRTVIRLLVFVFSLSSHRGKHLGRESTISRAILQDARRSRRGPKPWWLAQRS